MRSSVDADGGDRTGGVKIRQHGILQVVAGQGQHCTPAGGVCVGLRLGELNIHVLSQRDDGDQGEDSKRHYARTGLRERCFVTRAQDEHRRARARHRSRRRRPSSPSAPPTAPAGGRRRPRRRSPTAGHQRQIGRVIHHAGRGPEVDAEPPGGQRFRGRTTLSPHPWMTWRTFSSRMRAVTAAERRPLDDGHRPRRSASAV